MIIVTGGTGFIGSNLVAALEAQGEDEIVICDTLGSDDKWRNIAKREIRDIVHPTRLFDYLETHQEKIKAIFHMGAISSTTERDVDLIAETNIVDAGFNDVQDSDELSKLSPLNAYGWSKHVFDRRVARVLKEQSEDVPTQWAGLKFFNVYGPNEYHKADQMSVVCKLYPQVAAGASAKLFKSHHPDYEDGGQLRDFIYVKDCVKVMMWLYNNPQVSGLFNVGTGKAQSFKDLAEATFSAAGKEPKITYIDMPESLREKYQYFTQADMNKLRDAGYGEAFMTLEQGVDDYVTNYLATEDAYL